MVGNITVAILAIIMVGTGIFAWWLSNNDGDDDSSTKNDK